MGRPASKRGPKPKPQQQPPAAAAPAPARRHSGQPANTGTSSNPYYDCLLGCGERLTKSGLKGHVELVHHLTIGQASYRSGRTVKGKPIEYVCRECDPPAGYAVAQAIVMHRTKTHGDAAPVIADRWRVRPA